MTIKFEYNNLNKEIEVTQKDKIEKVIIQYFYLSQFTILHNGDIFQSQNKTIEEFADKQDKENNKITFCIYDSGSDTTDIGRSIFMINEYKNYVNFKQAKIILIKLFLILISQFILLLLFLISGTYTGFNEILIGGFAPLTNIIIPLIILITLIILSYIFQKRIDDDKKNKKNIIYIILYPIIMLYFCLFLSYCFGKKYIIFGLLINIIEETSVGIYSVFFNRFNLLYFGITASSASMVALIFFSIFLIKTWWKIILMILYWCIISGYNILWIWIYTSENYCEFEDYFYSIIIFDYGVFFWIAYGVIKIKEYTLKFFRKIVVPESKKVWEFIKSIPDKILDFIRVTFYYIKDRIDKKEDYFLKIYGYYFIQYFLITLFVWIGFSHGWNEWFKWNISSIIYTLIIHFAAFCFFFIFKCSRSIEDNNFSKIRIYNIIIYIPIMILYYFSLSSIIEEKYILSVLLLIFLDALSILFSNFYFKSVLFFNEFYICIFVNVISLIYIHFLWLKNVKAILIILSLSLSIFAYFAAFPYFILKYLKNYINAALLIFDNSIFIIIFLLLSLIVRLLFEIIKYFSIFCKIFISDDDISFKSMDKDDLLSSQYD